MAELTRSHGWEETGLGSLAGWPDELVVSVNLILSCRFPCLLMWGAGLAQFYNDAFRPLIEDKHPEALGQGARECWREAWPVIGSQIEAALAHGEATSQENLLVPVERGGRLRDIFWTYSYSPVYDLRGEVGGVLVVCHDTTGEVLAGYERDKAEEELRVERASLADTFHQAPAFIAVLRGPDHVIEMCNPAYLRLVGERRVIGKPVVEALPEVAAQGYIGLLDQVYRTGESVVSHNARVEFERTIGQPLQEAFVDFVYQPRRDVAGEISGIIVLGVDVTERRRAEQALIQTEKLAAVGRLASSIAHEINNPLEAVTNLLYLARGSDGATEEIGEYLDLAETELRRVAVITSQTLSFYRQATHPRAVTCDDLFDSVLSVFQGRLVNSRIRVEKRKRAAKAVLCFEGEIRQVLSNLVGNAIDAMLAQGGRLLLRSREATHWPSVRKGLSITIADTGGGIGAENLKKIFEAFFSTKGAAGNGLGLWISKEIVDRHKGVLRVRSSQREGSGGTVFTLFLPFAASRR